MNCIALCHFSANLRNKTKTFFFSSMSTKQVQFYFGNHDYNDFNESLYDWDSRSEDRGARSAWHNQSKSIPAEWPFTTPLDCLATSPQLVADVRLPAGKHSQVTSVCVSSSTYICSAWIYVVDFLLSSPIQNTLSRYLMITNLISRLLQVYLQVLEVFLLSGCKASSRDAQSEMSTAANVFEYAEVR